MLNIFNRTRGTAAKRKGSVAGFFNASSKAGFSMVELIVIIAILAVFAILLVPSLMQYTENSRAQKDESAMDEVVNAVQLAMADQNCYDEMLQYSCTNNYITYTDSSGIYGQVIADGEFWAPDGSGRATTITFNPEIGPNGDTVYDLDKALVNDMTYGNGSVGTDRVMEGALIANNQCYLKDASLNGEQTGYLYNKIRQTIGDTLITTSATYRNSSYTVFIKFSQQDSVTVADVDGSFNGTNLHENAAASLGSGTSSYDKNGDAIVTVTKPGTTTSTFTSSDLSGGGEFYPEYSKEGGVVPSGGTYITSDGQVLTEGMEITMRPQPGDVYKDEWYEYRYCQSQVLEYDDWLWDSYYVWEENSYSSWGVRVLNDSLSEYGDMQSVINGADVSCLDYTFTQCTNLVKAPKISTKTKYMVGTFRECTKLSDISNISIPTSVNDMAMTFQYTAITTTPRLPDRLTSLTNTFWGCTKLTTVTNLPSELKTMSSTFAECTSLVNPPSIPYGVTEMTSTFNGCTSLVKCPNIPGSVTEMVCTFSGCTSLTDNGLPTIPASVTYLGGTFSGCTSLVDASKLSIPSSVTKMSSTFAECTKLQVAPTLPKNLTIIDSLFKNCTSLQYSPAIPNGVTSMEYTFMGCTSLVKAPSIPNTVTKMYSTFRECSSLVDISALTLPSNITSLTCTFMDCTSLKTAPVIPNSVEEMSYTFKGCTSLVTAPVIPAKVDSLLYCFENCKSLTGEITISTSLISKLTSSGWYSAYHCLYGTKLPITIRGTGSNTTTLNTIKNSANNGNVTIK